MNENHSRCNQLCSLIRCRLEPIIVSFQVHVQTIDNKSVNIDCLRKFAKKYLTNGYLTGKILCAVASLSKEIPELVVSL